MRDGVGEVAAKSPLSEPSRSVPLQRRGVRQGGVGSAKPPNKRRSALVAEGSDPEIRKWTRCRGCPQPTPRKRGSHAQEPRPIFLSPLPAPRSPFPVPRSPSPYPPSPKNHFLTTPSAGLRRKVKPVSSPWRAARSGSVKAFQRKRPLNQGRAVVARNIAS